MVTFCDILLAEVVDNYERIFANSIAVKYSSKSRSVDEVMNQLLKGELQVFRRLTEYSFKVLSAAMLQRAIETGPVRSPRSWQSGGRTTELKTTKAESSDSDVKWSVVWIPGQVK
jgi:hypothetical protein